MDNVRTNADGSYAIDVYSPAPIVLVTEEPTPPTPPTPGEPGGDDPEFSSGAAALGIVLGVLFGKLNISFSDSLSFSPGLTGGILMVALFLSAIGKTGPILWSMSGPANQLLRQLGLLLFLAEVGTSAGRNLMATFQESGWLLFGVGAAITLVPMLVAVCVGLFVFKINILDLLGTITGGMTSTPGLAAADSMTDSNIPSVAYATVYPIAMVFLILIIQVIASAVY